MLILFSADEKLSFVKVLVLNRLQIKIRPPIRKRSILSPMLRTNCHLDCYTEILHAGRDCEIVYTLACSQIPRGDDQLEAPAMWMGYLPADTCNVSQWQWPWPYSMIFLLHNIIQIHNGVMWD